MLRTVASAIQWALDIILPRKDRVVRIADYRTEDFPIDPQEHEAYGVRITTLMRYHDSAVEDCIRALKYDNSTNAAKLLASLLADYLHEEIAQMKAFSPKPILLVPMPLHLSRERERGFNQITRVLESLQPEFKDGTLTRLAPKALRRTRATKQQTRLSRSERLSNVRDAFASDEETIRGCHVILVDDVTTTGATLAAAAHALGGGVTLLALARA